MTKKLLISRYNEDLDWVENLNMSTVIYNKGNTLSEDTIKKIEKNKPSFEIKNVANIGQEAYAYIHYFYNNYENLDDITIHLQGMPFDHIGNYCSVIKENNFNIATRTKYNEISLIYKEKIDNFVLFLNNFNLDCFFGFGILHTDLGFLDEIKKFFKALKIPLIRQDFGNLAKYTVGAQFCVSKHIVHRNKKELYGEILNCFDEQAKQFKPHIQCLGAIDTYCIANVLERSLFDFFQIDFNNPGDDLCNFNKNLLSL